MENQRVNIFDFFYFAKRLSTLGVPESHRSIG